MLVDRKTPESMFEFESGDVTFVFTQETHDSLSEFSRKVFRGVAVGRINRVAYKVRSKQQRGTPASGYLIPRGALASGRLRVNGELPICGGDRDRVGHTQPRLHSLHREHGG